MQRGVEAAFRAFASRAQGRAVPVVAESQLRRRRRDAGVRYRELHQRPVERLGDNQAV